MKNHICSVCGIEFSSPQSSRKYCSNKCSSRLYRQKIKEEYERRVLSGEIIESFCECGCSETAKVGNRVILGHNCRGINHPMFGRHHTDESNRKNREAHKGKQHSEKTKKKIRKALMGEKNHFYGKHHTEEAKRKNREAHIGIKNSGMTGKHHTPESNQKNREKHLGTHHSVEARDKISEASKSHWRDSEYVKKMWESQNRKPNLLEQDFGSVFPALKFVGDFSFMVGRKNPDFILPRTNVCVDVFGDYFHRPEEVHDRKKYFKELGYDLTIIWEHEWKEQREQIISQVNNVIQSMVVS